MVKVKICGITNLHDALCAVEEGADALGFVFYPGSPRFVRPEDAAQIIKALPRRVKKIGVFVNSRVATVKRCARLCGLDMVQLHGNESVRFCRSCRHLHVIKALRVRGAVDPGKFGMYADYARLLDAYVPGKPGGTGTVFNWQEAFGGLKIARRGELFLSGGLNARNVPGAIRLIRPDWVDVSSSVESEPGKKDRRRIKAFIKAVKRS